MTFEISTLISQGQTLVNSAINYAKEQSEGTEESSLISGRTPLEEQGSDTRTIFHDLQSSDGGMRAVKNWLKAESKSFGIDVPTLHNLDGEISEKTEDDHYVRTKYQNDDGTYSIVTQEKSGFLFWKSASEDNYTINEYTKEGQLTQSTYQWNCGNNDRGVQVTCFDEDGNFDFQFMTKARKDHGLEDITCEFSENMGNDTIVTEKFSTEINPETDKKVSGNDYDKYNVSYSKLEKIKNCENGYTLILDKGISEKEFNILNRPED